MPLFFIFIVVPLLELMLLLEVGAIIGSGWTFLIIILTAIVGTKLVKQQGLSTWQNIQQRLAQGELPAKALFDGVCILVSGVLLITPGFMTDIFGLLLLTPVFRQLVYAKAGSKIQVVGGQHSPFQQHSSFGQNADVHEHTEFGQNKFQNHDVTREDDSHSQPTTIDGEFSRKD